ncbi:MAG: phage antirepressor KilAC domain-containing protein [Clostridium sp.]
MFKGIDEEEKLMQTILASGQTREMWFLTEDGLYEVLMQSRKPIAKEFKKEVKKVLKDIRKNGLYVNTNTLDEMIAAQDLAIEMLQRIKEEKTQVKNLNGVIKEQKSKVVFADAVTKAETTILVGEMVKIIRQNAIDIGQNRMFKWLREKGYLIKQKGKHYNMPTQKSMELELFKIKETVISKKNGENEITELRR